MKGLRGQEASLESSKGFYLSGQQVLSHWPEHSHPEIHEIYENSENLQKSMESYGNP